VRDRAWKRDRDHDHDREREHGRDRSQDRGRVADRRRGAPGPRGQKKAAGRPYGPSRDKLARRKAAQGREEHTPKYDEPAVPEHVTGSELDAEVRAELRALPKDLAGRVSRHLVMAGRLSEEDPQTSYAHAKAARRLASRVGIVREAAGLSAYRAGEWSDALAELRAARRLGTGGDAYLPVMADCERGMGRPERALDLIKSAEGARLDQAGRIELRIVESGARRDLQQYEAAVVALQVPELKDRRLRPWSARLFYAYADALEAAGRRDEASDWFARAAAADRDGETDAAERYAELEGLHIIDTEEDESGAEPADSDEAPPSPTGEEPAEAAETPRTDDAGDAPATAGEAEAAGGPRGTVPDAPEISVVFQEPVAAEATPAAPADASAADDATRDGDRPAPADAGDEAPEISVVFREPVARPEGRADASAGAEGAVSGAGAAQDGEGPAEGRGEERNTSAD
jgi:tetratricopeptide (TPR) repeat protein